MSGTAKGMGGVAGRPPVIVKTSLTELGLASSFKFILDAGDANSYTSGQSWLDVSGNGQDFFLGTDNTVSATDPTFTGTVGSTAAYWLCDGGDYFTYDSANETWMANVHKDNGTLSLFMWIYRTSTATQAFISTKGTSGVGNGFKLAYTSSKINFGTGNGTTSPVDVTTAASMPINAWTFIGVSFNEAAGAGGLTIQINATQESFDSTAASPSAVDPTFAMKLLANTQGGQIVASGTRLGAIAASDTVLTAAQLNSIYLQTRSRFQ